MNRRSLASLVVFSLLVLLLATAVFLPVPYVTESPGPTVNVLGSLRGQADHRRHAATRPTRPRVTCG